jgi:hypothetical protein
MSNTDFFDDDLVQQRDAAKSIRVGPGGERPGMEPGDSDGGLPGKPVSDFNLTRMAQHREGGEESVAHATEELERLRQRQENLEKEKKTLEDLRRRQEDYENGKREIIENLGQSLLSLERDEIRSGQVTELLASTRERFKTMLDEIDRINEDSWMDDAIREEMGKAMAIIEDARIEYNKALAKIQAVTGGEQELSTADRTPVIVNESRYAARQELSFSYWLKVGVAISLPLVITFIVIAVVFYYLSSRGFL